MLRGAVITLGVVCIAGGLLAGLAGGAGAGWGALLFGAVLLLGTLYERVHYKPVEKAKPGPGWERTAERFYDEELGRTVTVYLQPATGERMYVED